MASRRNAKAIRDDSHLTRETIDETNAPRDTPSMAEVDTSGVEGLDECLALIDRVRERNPEGLEGLEQFTQPNPILTGSDETPVQTIGRFQIRGTLGQGGFGIVFLAFDPQLEREVALKIPWFDSLLAEDSRGRFVREAKSVAALSHENIATVFEAGQVGPVCYIACELYEGGSLAEFIERHGRLDPDVVARLMATVAGAVQHAHSRGILHRDLKPANLMLAEATSPSGEAPSGSRLSDTVRVTDFGLARQLDDPQQTRAGALVGTPAYMSPEQADSRLEDISTASDIYALGAIMYEMLTGNPPVKKDSVLATLQAVCSEEPVPPRETAGVPRDLDAICLKCLEKAPAARYASCSEFAVDLNRYVAGQAVVARPITMAERSVRWCRRNPLLTSLGLMLCLTITLGCVSGFALWLRSEEHRRVAETKSAELLSNNEQLVAAKGQAEARREEALAAKADAERESEEARSIYLSYIRSFRQTDPFKNPGVVTAADVLDSAMQDLAQDTQLKPHARAALLTAIGESYHGMGLPAQALPVLQKSRALFEQQGDEVGEQRVWCLVQLGMVQLALGNVQEALALQEESVRVGREFLGPDNPRTEFAVNQLALTLRAAGQAERGLPLLQELYEKLQQEPEDEDNLLLQTMNNLALLLESTGERVQALPLYEAALKKSQARFGDDHPQTLSAMSNLALSYLTNKQLDRAFEMLQTTLEMRREHLGEEHPETLASMNNLAGAYVNLGQLDQALPLLEEVKGLMTRKLGVDHPTTMQITNNLATLYLRTGHPTKAAPMLRDVGAAMQEKLGAEHPLTLMALKNYASAHEEAGNLELSVGLLRKLVAIKREHQPQQRPELRSALDNLGRCLARLQRYEEAEPILAETLELWREESPAHWRTAAIQSTLGEALTARQKFAEAEPLLLEGYAVLDEKTPKMPVWERGRQAPLAARRLVTLYDAWGKKEEADRWRTVLVDQPAGGPEAGGQ